MILQKCARYTIVAAAAACTAVGSVSAQVNDPSFENVCSFAPFEGWTPIGGNQFQSNTFARTGVRTAFMYGNFFPGATPANPTGLNDVGFQQVFTVAPGSDGLPVQASAWILNQSNDPLGFNCYAFVVLDFLAGNTPVGTPLTSVVFGNGTNPLDAYVELPVSGTVPAGATTARFSVILQQQLDFTSNPAGVYRGGSVRYDDASVAINGGASLLVNGGFESICVKPFFDWESFGLADHVSSVEVRTGAFSNKVFGPFFNPGNTGGSFQETPATAGTQWQGGIYYLSRADDQINAAIDARVRLEFYDNTNVVIGLVDAYQSADLAQGAATPTTWTLANTPLVTAPTGTTKVRLVIIHTVPNFQGGAIYYDDASLVQVTGSCCVSATCSLSNAGACSGTFASGGVCAPNPCSAPATGACCAGSTCSATTSAACTGANTQFAGSSTVCNAPGNNVMPCCKADFNQSGGVSVQDIFDFLSGSFSANPQADINGGGVSVQDIFDYLGAYFTGC